MPLQLPATADDYRRLARARLPRFLFDYIDGGATDEQTVRANVADWATIALRQRVLVDVDGIDTSATLLGQACSMPLALAPVGLAGLMARRGEAQAARAARAAGVPFTLSTVGICPLAEVTEAAGPVWFQLYMLRDRGVVRALLQRAWESGCRTLVFTVDLPVSGMRHRDTRNGLESASARARLIRAGQLLSRPAWLLDVAVRGQPHAFGNLTDQVPGAADFTAFKAWVDTQFDPSVTWAEIDWLRAQWQGAIALKGVLDAEDATAAVRAGVQGIVVSNHGGRQLDGVASTVAKLPAIVQAVGGGAEVLVDGGIRSGVDVFRALALGARGALIGRPWAFALAAAGERGVSDLLSRWRRELLLAMTLTGARSPAEIDGARLDRPKS
ncbi:L-lactate dehydrogenase (cytochrome) [Roseiarcus fermentans]|uniref:L-lactate dehydrogenase (Cytochrome) n=1 Tax=Roseiarcus fermentans TaxID=1473586 RepID=A0A366FQG6_9HYPH|nr:L-lactate dehydrogenase [Roseiarcus fermentans]RBP16892.1 L-lactate dehydrogenase (cytochrome) [Roseiarcus fermentans]